MKHLFKYSTNEITVTLEQQVAWLKEEVMALTDATEKEVKDCMKCPNHKNVVNHYVGRLIRERGSLFKMRLKH